MIAFLGALVHIFLKEAKTSSQKSDIHQLD